MECCFDAINVEGEEGGSSGLIILKHNFEITVSQKIHPVGKLFGFVRRPQPIKPSPFSSQKWLTIQELNNNIFLIRDGLNSPADGKKSRSLLRVSCQQEDPYSGMINDLSTREPALPREN